MISPTGRCIGQQVTADRWLQRMQEMLMSTPGVRCIANDAFEIDLSQVDFSEIEKRVLIAMQEDR